MLHELLIALSGHPSPLFEDQSQGQDQNFLLSPSEKALLQSIGQLSRLHARLKQSLDDISLKHASMICRATAASMQHVHLRRFQQKILDVESKILTKDASIVGAYNIVPLASVVSEFDEWQRLMSWYWELSCFISDSTSDYGPKSSRPGASLIDHLRNEMQTGYPEVKQAATELARIAEASWLKQVTSWLIYGSIPTLGAHDFFIQSRTESEIAMFVKDTSLLPEFVTTATASAILFTGNSIHQVRSRRKDVQFGQIQSNARYYESEIATSHLAKLSELSLPITSSHLSRTISDIKMSLSQNVLQYLLPLEATQQLLSCLWQFFLLSRGSFAVALIEEAEHRLQMRQQGASRLLYQDLNKAVRGLSIKDGELYQALQQVWKALALKDDHGTDDDLEFAREHVFLTLAESPSRPTTSDSTKASYPDISTIAFNDLLLPGMIELRLAICSPLDLFLSKKDIDIYSSMNAYLLAIRRAHMRLSELWRRTSIRRGGSESSSVLRKRKQQRDISMRKVWATCSAAVFLLSETTAFFEGEIIQGSCDNFSVWVKSPVQQDDHTEASELKDPRKVISRDPEILASGHRALLASLVYSLLLTDFAYTRELRRLLGNIDRLIAFFDRLLDVQQRHDLELHAERQGNGSGLGRNAQLVEDEVGLSLELDRARKNVDSDLRSVVNRLRALNQERIGSLRHVDLETTDTGGFEAWQGIGGVGRLLMKLDFGRATVNDGVHDIL